MTLVDESVPGARPVTVWHLVHSGVMPAMVAAPEGVDLREQIQDTALWSARMYARIGAPWHWVDRLDWQPGDWQTWVDRPGHWLGLVWRHGEPCGYLELTGDTEIAFLGLDQGVTGEGIGRWLLTQAVRLGLSRPTTRALTVHTCALDHPSALANYQARGFVVQRTETEWRLVPPDPAQSRS